MKNPLDYPDKNDNRRYDYSNTPYFERGEYPYICDLIPENSKIIDLGCGNGSLLKYISKRKHIQGLGIELVESGVKATIKNGFKAFIGEIDKAETYRSFKEKEFDYAICNVTIQMVMYPEILLQEMKRISKYQIISFPNFAFFRNRLDLLFHGRMPKPMLYGYEWFNTGHIHQLSINDFKKFCLKNDLRIIKEIYDRPTNPFKKILIAKFPNLFATIAIFLCREK